MLKDQLQQLYTLEEYKAAPGWYRYTDETPAFFFQDFVNFHLLKGHALNVSIRGKPAEEKIAGFLNTLSKKTPHNATDHLVKLEKMHFPGLEMDAALFLPPPFHEILETDEMLHQKTIVAFPIFHSEFNGKETPDEMKSMMEHNVVTIDWERPVSSKIRMRYNNVVTKGKSSGKQLGLTTLPIFWREFDRLEDPKSFIEIQNYLDAFARITESKPGQLRVEDKDQQVLTEGSRDKVTEFIRAFLMD